MNFKYPPSQITKCLNQDVPVTLKLLITQMDKDNFQIKCHILNGSELDENVGAILKDVRKIRIFPPAVCLTHWYLLGF